MTDTDLINYLNSYDVVEIRVKPDAFASHSRTIYAGALMGGYGSAIDIRAAVKEDMERNGGV